VSADVRSFLFTIDNWGNLQSAELAAALRSYWDSVKSVMVGANYNGPTRILDFEQIMVYVAKT
jgi:hypothetical protein